MKGIAVSKYFTSFLIKLIKINVEMLVSEHYIMPVVSLESHLEIFNMDIKVTTVSNLLFPLLSAFPWT